MPTYHVKIRLVTILVFETSELYLKVVLGISSVNNVSF